MVIDFRKKRRTTSQPWCILGKDVEVVEDYKYLVLPSTTDWTGDLTLNLFTGRG